MCYEILKTKKLALLYIPKRRKNFLLKRVMPIGQSIEIEEEEEEGRRMKLATRVMSNGVEVIVAGPTPALRWENSNLQPTLTLSDAVLMMLPQEQPNDFVTKTCTTTFTYFNTLTKNGTTIVSTNQQVRFNDKKCKISFIIYNLLSRSYRTRLRRRDIENLVLKPLVSLWKPRPPCTQKYLKRLILI